MPAPVLPLPVVLLPPEHSATRALLGLTWKNPPALPHVWLSVLHALPTELSELGMMLIDVAGEPAVQTIDSLLSVDSASALTNSQLVAGTFCGVTTFMPVRVIVVTPLPPPPPHAYTCVPGTSVLDTLPPSHDW